MSHDEQCEIRTSQFAREVCNCAERAYNSDPMLDDDGRPIKWGRGYGTAAPLRMSHDMGQQG